jgi:hypothetical protein
MVTAGVSSRGRRGMSAAVADVAATTASAVEAASATTAVKTTAASATVTTAAMLREGGTRHGNECHC